MNAASPLAARTTAAPSQGGSTTKHRRVLAYRVAASTIAAAVPAGGLVNAPNANAAAPAATPTAEASAQQAQGSSSVVGSSADLATWRAAEARSDLATRVPLASTDEYARSIGEDSPTLGAIGAVATQKFLDDVGSWRWREAYAQLSPEARSAVGGYAGFIRDGGLARRLEPFASVPLHDYLAEQVTDGASAVAVPGQVLKGDGAAFDVASLGVRSLSYGVEDGGLRIDAGASPTRLALAPATRQLTVRQPFTLTVDRRGQRGQRWRWSTGASRVRRTTHPARGRASPSRPPPRSARDATASRPTP